MKIIQAGGVVLLVYLLASQIICLDKRVERLESTQRSDIAYVFICKKMPQQGQVNWINWLKDNGQCEKAAFSVREDSK